MMRSAKIYTLHQILKRVIKSRNVKWAGRIGRLEIRNEFWFEILTGKQFS